MTINSIENFDETKVKIGSSSWDSEEMRQLWAKSELSFRSLCDYWTPAYRDGKKCMDYLLGNIFDPEVRAYYEDVQQKVCIEPRVLKPRINTICGQIIKGKKSGKVTSEKGGMSATEAYQANTILKFLEMELKEDAKLDSMVFTGCVTGCPQVAKFDLAETPCGHPIGGLTLDYLPWDSVVVSPFCDPSGDDITEMVWMSRLPIGKLIDENPDQEKQIKHHYNNVILDKNFSALLQSTGGLNVETARYLNFDVITGSSNTALDGRALCCERWFTTKVKLYVAIAEIEQSIDILDYQIFPSNWTEERRGRWIRQNPGYKLVQRDVKVIWVTRWTREGLVLKNEMHWFQESNSKGDPILPAVVFVPQIIDGVPTGPGPDLRPLVLMNAISETEYLHDIRMGSGDLLGYIEGTVKNHADLPTEMTRPQGIVVFDQTKVADASKAVTQIRRTPSEKYGQYANKVRNDMVDTDLVTPSLMGQQVPDESGKSKALNIGQSMLAYQHMADNFNETFSRIKNLECQLIPYAFTEEQVIQIYDEDLQEDGRPVAINQVEYDLDGNRIINPASDLSGAKWRYRLTTGDDSATAREQEMNEMLVFWNTTAPTLIQADTTLSLLSSVLISMKNNTAKEVGRVISEKAQVQAKQMSQQQMTESMATLEEAKGKADAARLKAIRSGFSFSITPDDLVKNPQVYQLLVASNYINAATGAFQYPGLEEKNPQGPVGDMQGVNEEQEQDQMAVMQ
jgi:hypothetical protein